MNKQDLLAYFHRYVPPAVMTTTELKAIEDYINNELFEKEVSNLPIVVNSFCISWSCPVCSMAHESNRECAYFCPCGVQFQVKKNVDPAKYPIVISTRIKGFINGYRS